MTKKKIAQIISFTLHPIIFAIFIPFLVVYKYSLSIPYGLFWSLISFFFLFLAAVTFYILAPKNASESLGQLLDISSQKKRDIFYAVCTFFALLYFITSLILKGELFPLSIIALGTLLGIISFNLINMYIKLSIHTAIVTAFVVTIGILYGFFSFLGVLLLLPLIIWARLTLHKHNRYEILAGAAVGIMACFITVFIYKQLYI